MRNILSTGLLLILFLTGISAQSKVVNWSVETQNISDTEIVVSLVAHIDKGWKLYSQHTAEGGPIPTEITFAKVLGIDLIGDVKESENVMTEYSDLFEINVSSFKNHATFSQHIKLSNSVGNLSAKVTYMACDGLKCIPPRTEEFPIEL